MGDTFAMTTHSAASDFILILSSLLLLHLSLLLLNLALQVQLRYVEVEVLLVHFLATRKHAFGLPRAVLAHVGRRAHSLRLQREQLFYDLSGLTDKQPLDITHRVAEFFHFLCEVNPVRRELVQLAFSFVHDRNRNGFFHRALIAKLLIVIRSHCDFGFGFWVWTR